MLSGVDQYLRSKGQNKGQAAMAGQEERTARSVYDRDSGCAARTVRFSLSDQLFHRHGVWPGICAAVNDFRASVTPPAQPLAAAITKGDKLTLHGEPAPGADVVGGPSKAVTKHLQLGHRHRDAPAGQGEDSSQKQRRRIH